MTNLLTDAVNFALDEIQKLVRNDHGKPALVMAAIDGIVDQIRHGGHGTIGADELRARTGALTAAVHGDQLGALEELRKKFSGH